MAVLCQGSMMYETDAGGAQIDLVRRAGRQAQLPLLHDAGKVIDLVFEVSQIDGDIGMMRLHGRQSREKLILEQQVVVGQRHSFAFLVKVLAPGGDSRLKAAAALAGLVHWWISRIWSGSSTWMGSLLPSRMMISTRRFWARCCGVSLGTLGRVSA